MKGMMRMATALALAGVLAGGCNAQAATMPKAKTANHPKASAKAKAGDKAVKAVSKLKTLTLTGLVSMIDAGRSKGRFQLLTAAGEKLLLPAGKPAKTKNGITADPATSVPSYAGQQVRLTVLVAEHRSKTGDKVRLSIRKITAVDKVSAAA